MNTNNQSQPTQIQTTNLDSNLYPKLTITEKVSKIIASWVSIGCHFFKLYFEFEN